MFNVNDHEKRISKIEEMLQKKCRSCGAKLPVGEGLTPDAQFCGKSCRGHFFWQQRCLELYELIGVSYYDTCCYLKDQTCSACIDKIRKHLQKKYGARKETY